MLIDEAEKTFKDNQECLLKVIDGVYNDYRKLYVLTTNRLSIDENLIGRPGRIRYIRYFGNLTVKAVSDYIDDNLLDKSMKGAVLDVVDTLEISTIDILKCIVDEFNIHGMIPEGSLLNIPKANYRFDVIEFCHVPEERIGEVKAFIKSRIGNNESIASWLAKTAVEPVPKNPDPDEDDDDEENETCTNEQLLRNTFGLWLWRTKITSIYPTLFKEQYTRHGIIKETPDENGFFIIQDDGEDELWCITRGHSAPSLYRGGLVL